MIKKIDQRNETSIFFPEGTPCDNYLTILQTGHGFSVTGNSFSKNKNIFALHYVISGQGICAGEKFSAPCGLLFTPDGEYSYSIDESSDAPQFEQYWIIFKGCGAKKLLESSGFAISTGVFDTPYMARTADVFRSLHNLNNYFSYQDSLYMKAMFFQLLSLHVNSAARLDIQTKKASKQYISQAISFIEKSYYLPLREDDIAASVHISSKYLYKLFRKELEVSPTQYLNIFRIQRAQKLLEDGTLTVKEIATEVGFSDPDYFCRVFQKYSSGLSPTQYRKKL